MSSGIYVLFNRRTHKGYIGSSTDITRRTNRHFYDLRRGLHHSEHLQRAWCKYGEYNFNVYVLEYCSTENLERQEQFYIDKHRTYLPEFGYNVVRFAGNNLRKLTDQDIVSIRENLEAGIKQQDIAVKFGIHQGTVSKLSTKSERRPRLTKEEVQDILAEKAVSQKYLANYYRVNQSTISRILRGQTWAQVAA